MPRPPSALPTSASSRSVKPTPSPGPKGSAGIPSWGRHKPPPEERHDGHRDTRGLGFRYAVCNDGKVLSRGQVTGWKVSRYTPDQIAEFAGAGKLTPDTSSGAQAITTRANTDAHYHEHAKWLRRVTR